MIGHLSLFTHNLCGSLKKKRVKNDEDIISTHISRAWKKKYGMNSSCIWNRPVCRETHQWGSNQWLLAIGFSSFSSTIHLSLYLNTFVNHVKLNLDRKKWTVICFYTCIIDQNINCSPFINSLWKLTLINSQCNHIAKKIKYKRIQVLLTAFIIDSTSSSFDTSPPKVIAWPPYSLIYNIQEFHILCTENNKWMVLLGKKVKINNQSSWNIRFGYAPPWKLHWLPLMILHNLLTPGITTTSLKPKELNTNVTTCSTKVKSCNWFIRNMFFFFEVFIRRKLRDIKHQYILLTRLICCNYN